MIKDGFNPIQLIGRSGRELHLSLDSKFGDYFDTFYYIGYEGRKYTLVKGAVLNLFLSSLKRELK